MRRTIRAAVVAAMTFGLLIAGTGAAQASPNVADGASPPALLNARAAAGAAGGIGFTTSWFTGIIAAGASQNWAWTPLATTPATAAYVVGFNPSGASTSATCPFEMTSSRYVQQPGGGRQFHFTIKNIGSIACGATILLTMLTGSTIGSTGSVSPGGSQTHLWTNLPVGMTFLAGLQPSGATSTSPCQFQVTRTWYVQQPGAARQFWFTIKNVGAITCQADLHLANTTGGSTYTTGSLNPGVSKTNTWNNANPVTSAYLIGLAPGSAYPDACQMEVTRLYYRQRINSDGSSERELSITVKNVGTAACQAIVYLPRIAA
ncbi:MAG TPA: hypothetical protein DGT23_19315 [Micromonosporaceae bacterium]|nr:hypothetical protein [Micromonosporaceae bacterium]